MKILVLNYEFPPVGGGGGRAAEDIGRGLAQRGHKVHVLTSHVAGLPLCEERCGLHIERIRCLRRRADRCTVPEMAAFVLLSLVPTWRAIRRLRPDLLHVHFAVPTGVVAFVMRWMTGVPYLLTVHLGDVPGGVPEQTGMLFRWLKPFTMPIWRAAAGLTGVSSFVCDLAERAYGVRPQVVFNGIDLASIEQACSPGGALRLVWCGRMQAQKNLVSGLRELALVTDVDWRLDIVGDGPLRSQVEETIAACGFTGRVTLHGWLSPEGADAVMSKADVLYLPSLSEGLSLVTVQALAAGLAIIGSRIGGLTDVVIDGHNGYLCSLEQSGAFAKAVRTLGQDAALLARMKVASRAHAEAFSLEHIVDQYETLCRRVGVGKGTA